VVGELYDYIVSIIVVGIIFVSGVLAVPAIGYLNLRHVDEQQLRNTALNVFDTILLDAGAPSRWGSVYPFDQEAVEQFGLSDERSSSLFVLDSDKVQRLDPLSPGYITYEKVNSLLGLEGYGFALTLFRPFQVDYGIAIFAKETPERVWFSVNVSRNEDGRPIANAQVRVTIMATASNINKEDPIAMVNNPATYYTDALGRCTGNATMNLEVGYTLDQALAIMRITVAGITTLVVANTDPTLQEVLRINTFGDTVTLTMRGEFDNVLGERRIKQINAYDFDTMTRIYDGSSDPTATKVNNGISYDWWNMTFPGLDAMDPALLLFTISVPNPRRLVIVAGPFSFWDANKVFQFGPDMTRIPAPAATLRRYVVFSGITYVAEITLWKEGS
jgi:hypothetical protein